MYMKVCLLQEVSYRKKCIIIMVKGVRYLLLANCVRLGSNITLSLGKEEELQELLRRMDNFFMRGCDMDLNRNKSKVIQT